MTDSLMTIAMIVCVLVVLPFAVLILKDRLQTRSPAEIEEYSRNFVERLHHPDFAAIEDHYSTPVPQTLRELYLNKSELDRGDFEVAANSDAKEDDRWFIAFYEPADSEAMKSCWPGTEKYFAFANDGADNEYLIDPRLPDSPVQFHDHETGEFSPVCSSFSEFMKWPRLTLSDT